MEKGNKHRRVYNYEIMAQLELGEGAGALAGVEQERQGKVLDEIHKIVYGNSNPSKGLLFRLLLVEKFQANFKRILWVTIGAAVVSIIGALI